MIPRLISQTWRSRTLPHAAARLSSEWQRLNVDFAYRLFTDEECAAVVADIAPHFLQDYLAFPHPVMRADFFRYAVIYRDGGVYADIDMECLRPVGALIAGDDAIFSVEALLTAERQRELQYARPFQIANCIFAAPPRHPFLQAAIERCVTLARQPAPVGRDRIEDVTGPRMLTRLFFDRAWADLHVLRQIHLMAPLHYPSAWPIGINMYSRHRCFGSWKEKGARRSIARRWIERDRWPDPFATGAMAMV